MRRAAENVKKIGLELGGKSPNIVFADADFDAAVDGALIGIFAGTGEVCSAGSRLLVERSIHDRFVGELVSRAMAIKVGDPLDAESEMGPLVSRQQLETVEKYVAHRQGGGRHAGDRRHRLSGERLLLRADDLRGRGQLRCASPRRRSSGRCWWSSRSTARKRPSASPTTPSTGSPAAVWTKDVTRAMRVIKATARRHHLGQHYHPTYSEAPCGGYKQSGIGRELGSYGLDEYTEVKQINIDLTDQPMGVYQRGKAGTGVAWRRGESDGRERRQRPQGRAAQRPAPVPRGRDEDGRGLGPVLRELQAVTSRARAGRPRRGRRHGRRTSRRPVRRWETAGAGRRRAAIGGA